ncbi:hypothetical protein SAMN04488082_1374 [Desulfomicrobium apsheronum]|uniref:Uncharacterized protein n=1 Tax=Desulfomicrobium apsheronum TaxID=52560 RepID=A0A1I4AF14_9BACT|nr:hypothetical protein SAMN04488082_1374 [Desulfomicrobium apsheronum]
MAAVRQCLLTLWTDARLAEKDGFFLMLGGGSIGMPWWNAEHVSGLLRAFRSLPSRDQAAFLSRVVNELPEVEHEG